MFKLKKLVKIEFLQNNILVILVFSLLSFISGNIFGLNSQNLFLNYPGILFLLCPLLLEILNFFIFFLTQEIFSLSLKKKQIKKYLYLIFISIRRGFLLGIFVEAFKVGS